MPPVGSYKDKNPLAFPKGASGAYEDDPNQPFAKTDYVKKKDDFEWIYSDEPHTTRRREILKQHPEIRQLFGAEPKTFWIVLGITISQLWIASWIGQSSWTVWLLVMYVYGATVNHTLQLANHEISHNLVFEGNLMANFFTGILAVQYSLFYIARDTKLSISDPYPFPRVRIPVYFSHFPPTSFEINLFVQKPI